MKTKLFYEQRIFEGINIPIRFSGNKRLWQDFIEARAKELPQNATVVDVFGGSGIVSYYITKIRPDLKVIYNDFDNYLDRVDHIEDLETIRQGLQKIAGKRTHGKIRQNNDLDKNKLSDSKKQKILDYLDDCKNKKMFIDNNVICTWLTHGFSARDKLTMDTLMLNGIPANPLNIDKAKEYADVLRPLKTKFDVRSIFKSKRLQKLLHDTSVYWVLDPPYRNTDTSDYKNEFSQELEDSIKEIINTNRVLLFCDEKEKDIYKKMFKTKCKTKNKEKNSFFNGIKRTECCLYSF